MGLDMSSYRPLQQKVNFPKKERRQMGRFKKVQLFPDTRYHIR
jgi:hypothetical protein